VGAHAAKIAERAVGRFAAAGLFTPLADAADEGAATGRGGEGG
jgi:hypothetical protein